MISTEEFSTDCPDGFQPIPLPTEWKTRDLLGNTNFIRLKFDIPTDINSIDLLIASIAKQLETNEYVNAACKQAMMRNRRNIFLVGLDDSVKEDVTNQIKCLQTSKLKERIVSISSVNVWIYQRCSDKPLV